MAKDLNKGQVIGVGAINMVWPGLNAPILKGREVVMQKRLPQDKDYMVNLLKVRNEMDTYRKTKQHPLDRGWSGVLSQGKWNGPPSPILDETFEGFNSKILMSRPLMSMQPGVGRYREVIAMVATGNQNGACGFAICIAKDQRVAIKRARNQAAQRLRYIERDPDGDTFVHDFVSQYGAVKVLAYKKPEGYGVVAHRVLKAICNVAGIRNAYCKVEGPTKNYRHLAKAFFLGLCNIKSFQAMADEKKLHVVEMREDNDFYPRIVASPSDGYVRDYDSIGADEVMDFRLYLNEGQVLETQNKDYPDYVKTQGFVKQLQIYQHIFRNKQNMRVYLKARYGRLDSFLTVREREDRARRKAMLALASEGKDEEKRDTSDAS